MAVEIVFIALCLFLNGLFASYEMAFVSLSKADLRGLSKQDSPRAHTLLKLRENPERTLSILQVGITLVGALSAAVGGAGASDTLEPFIRSQWNLGAAWANFIAITLVVVPLTFLNVVMGELVPKSLALRKPVGLALAGAPWVAKMETFFAPLVGVLEGSTRLILAVFFHRHTQEGAPQERLVDIESLAHHHQQAILNLAHIETKKVKDIYIKWSEVNYIKTADSMGDVVLMIFASGHTRLPVVDTVTGHIRGILHTKEALGLRETGNPKWQMLIRPLLSVQLQDRVRRT